MCLSHFLQKKKFAFAKKVYSNAYCSKQKNFSLIVLIYVKTKEKKKNCTTYILLLYRIFPVILEKSEFQSGKKKVTKEKDTQKKGSVECDDVSRTV